VWFRIEKAWFREGGPTGQQRVGRAFRSRRYGFAVHVGFKSQQCERETVALAQSSYCAAMVHPEIAMSDFFVDFVGRLVIMLPVILVLTAVLWLMFNRRRQSASAPAFSPSDMRTWSLRFALLDGAVFASTFALLSTWMADSAFSVGVSGGLAAIVAMAVMPWVAARYPRLSNK
jgi:hypothetical protein